jgi:hypothetical protein
MSSELRRIEFVYDGADVARADGAAGRVEYMPLPGGGWIVREWAIRMPVTRETSVQVTERGLARTRTERRLVREGMEESSGAVVDVWEGTRLVWSARTARISGVVRAQPSAGRPARVGRVRLELLGSAGEPARPLAVDSAGRFAIDSVEPGAHRISIASIGVDSLALAPDTVELRAFPDPDPPGADVTAPSLHHVVRRLCGPEAGDTASRAVIGTVRTAAGTLVPGATVQATFIARVREVSPGRLAAQSERRTTRADASGRFLICDVPAVRPIQLRARTKETSSDLVTLRIDGERAYGLLGLTLSR